MKTFKFFTRSGTRLGFVSSQFQTSLLIRAFAAENWSSAVSPKAAEALGSVILWFLTEITTERRKSVHL